MKRSLCRPPWACVPVAMVLILVSARGSLRVPDLFTHETVAPSHETGTPERQAPARSVWDGVYTASQAIRGELEYAAACTLCHLEDLTGDGVAPTLVGTTFLERWDDQSVNDLYATIRSTMPQATPFGLSAQAYIDMVAFLLRYNGYPYGGEELEPDGPTLEEITIQAERPQLESPKLSMTELCSRIDRLVCSG